jgi:putative tricarboxylic transport membrane protein
LELFNEFINILQVHNLIYITVGVTTGIVIGAMPGLTAVMGVTILIPFTFGIEATKALLLLAGVYLGGIYGGSVSAILIRTPGTPAAAATVDDGFALSQEGKPRKALEMALWSSCTAGFISVIALIIAAPQLAKIALKFGPPEIFTLALFGLTIIGSISGENITKGLLAGFLGLFFSTIGLDEIRGLPRFVFGNRNLLGGITFIPALIGLFALSEVFRQVELIFSSKKEITGVEIEKAGLSIKEYFSYFSTILRGSIIGIIIGAIPGTGAAIASFLSYDSARRVSKEKEKYGKGSLDAIAASESANNGVTGATFIPLLTLGIPGDVVTAAMLGAFLLQGLIPGPHLFKENPEVVYGLMSGMLVANVIMLFVGTIIIRYFTRVILVPKTILMPIIGILCLAGSFAINNSVFDLSIAFFFGLIGYILPKFGFPVTPIVIAMILGPMAETGFRQSIIMSEGSWLIFITRPIAMFFIFLTILSILAVIFRNKNIKKKRLTEF